MKKSKDTILFICKKDFLWNWDGFQILQHHFETVHLVTWDGNEEELPKIHEIIKELTYDYLISFWNEYYILPHEFGAAKKGAINIHPAPLEHPGLGMFSYIFAFPDKRLHHGTTVHEVNEKFDNGQIYISTKFPCYGMSPEEVARCSVMDSLNILEKIAQKLKMGGNTTILGDDDSNTPQWGAHFLPTGKKSNG